MKVLKITVFKAIKLCKTWKVKLQASCFPLSAKNCSQRARSPGDLAPRADTHGRCLESRQDFIRMSLVLCQMGFEMGRLLENF